MGLEAEKAPKVADLLTSRNAISCDAMSQPFRRTSPRPSSRAPLDRPKLLKRFAAEETNAHRLASSREVWIERFGEDILINYQRNDALAPARQALTDWRAKAGLSGSPRFWPIHPATKR